MDNLNENLNQNADLTETETTATDTVGADKLNHKLIVSNAPHIRGGNTTQLTMLDVIIALLPSLIAGIIIMGYRASLLTFVCVAACVIFEFLWQKLLKKESTINDLSAVVTGMLLAMNLPVTLPFWMAIIGCFVAIIIVKQFFGGIGHNFMNPALGARAFLLASWALPMTTWVAPFSKLHIIGNADAVTSATPLALLGGEAAGELPSYMDLFLGNIGGCIGEISTLAILIGAAYLVVRKVITLHTPIAYIGTVFVLSYAFGMDGVYQILAGGLMLGAFFMATDYTTTPYTKKGQIIFGIGCGLLTVVIRKFGGYPEGVSYSILLMNLAAPLIDRITAPKPFGTVKEAKKGEAA